VPGIRPRKATYGRDTRARSIKIEASTATSTPSSTPISSTPLNATAAAAKSCQLVFHRCSSSRTSIKPLTATSTTAARTASGKVRK
jgi:hypothetical protein